MTLTRKALAVKLGWYNDLSKMENDDRGKKQHTLFLFHWELLLSCRMVISVLLTDGLQVVSICCLKQVINNAKVLSTDYQHVRDKLKSLLRTTADEVRHFVTQGFHCQQVLQGTAVSNSFHP